jgi:uncharacterized membrane protein (DUF4010 family)
METINGYIVGFTLAHENLTSVLGFDVLLIIPVFMLVSVFKALFDHHLLSKYRKSLLTSLCFIVSFCLVWVTSHEQDLQTVAKHSLILGGLVSLSYQTVKGLLQWAVDKLFLKLEKSTGKDYEEPEIPL